MFRDAPRVVSKAYRRLVGHVIVTMVLASLVIAEAWLFVSPTAPQAIPASHPPSATREILVVGRR